MHKNIGVGGFGYFTEREFVVGDRVRVMQPHMGLVYGAEGIIENIIIDKYDHLVRMHIGYQLLYAEKQYLERIQ